ncbi:MAG: hypothetical protein NPIRA02_24330 [Nitrospirales bacterium]|nr:MAG: hypothetical protein NPIRA02_24330 [Nitrospirales bacterium]
MELLQTPSPSCAERLGSEVSEIHAKVLRALELYGPMPVEVLVEKTPLFRWVDVLRAVSQLWGDGRLELEYYQGQLMIHAISETDKGKFGEKRGRKWKGNLSS